MTTVNAASGDSVYKVEALIAEDIDAYLELHQHKTLLRFITCGSVDDGKSTLIGRMLYEAGAVLGASGFRFHVVELGEEPADEDAQSYRGAGEAAAHLVRTCPDMWRPL